ncbi:cytidylate kinase [Phycisphaerae bacterium RAS1]|nr:cytidylate kinase [Phycisphaerae bacterium RAS1]
MITRRASVGSLELDRLIERQLRNWELSRAQKRADPGSPESAVNEFITISRMIGSGGHEIAQRLGKRLNWPVFDKEILQHMAGDDALRRRLYDAMDERDEGWLEGMLRLVLECEFHQEEYFHRLIETVLALARKGHGVFLGRGAHLILPRECGLRVRLFAPRDVCIRRIAEREGVSSEDARRRFDETQGQRTDFVRRHFGPKGDGIEPYDLLINTGTVTMDQATEMIVAATKQWGK